MSLINVKYNMVNSLIIGGGKIAFRKAKRISISGGKVLVVAKCFIEDFQELRNYKNVNLLKDEYNDKYLEDKTLVICATNDEFLNDSISKLCHNNGILVNNVSNKELSSFNNVSLYESDKVEIGVSTKGLSPGISIAIRDILKDTIEEEIEVLIEEYCRAKKKIQRENPTNRDEQLNQLSKKYYKKIIGGSK